jgi:hypothetical protein
LESLEELVRDYPERVQLAEAHKQRAECLAALGSVDDAIAAYRNSLGAQRAFPQVRGLAYLGFAELILGHGREDLYPEALSLLDEFGREEMFPIHRYRSAATVPSFARRLLTQTRPRRVPAQLWQPRRKPNPRSGIIGSWALWTTRTLMFRHGCGSLQKASPERRHKVALPAVTEAASEYCVAGVSGSGTNGT